MRVIQLLAERDQLFEVELPWLGCAKLGKQFRPDKCGVERQIVFVARLLRRFGVSTYAALYRGGANARKPCKGRLVMNDAEYDEGEHVTEAFAYFGRAYYEAGVLDSALALAILFIDFLPSVKSDYVKNDRRNFDRPAYEAAYNKFLADQHAQTLGNLRKRLFASSLIEDALKAEIDEVKEKRGFIAHHYFRERAVEFVTRSGRDQMIAELDEIGSYIDAVAHKVDAVIEKAQVDLGIKPEVIAAYTRHFMDSVGLGERAP